MILAFLITAFLYASVGFGGGSTYNALLFLYDVDYSLIPKIALTCNLIVVAWGTIRYSRKGLIPWKNTIPLICVSTPFAWFGGSLLISKEVFLSTLGVTLLLSGLFLIIRQSEVSEISKNFKSKIGFLAYSAVSAILGFLAGLVGIGGGIFFSPILHLSKAMPSINIAAFSSIFILVNSTAGLIGQFTKGYEKEVMLEYLNYSWLFIAVFIGGLFGNQLGINAFKPIIIRRLTGVLVIYVAFRLLLGF
tara:strand:+ start:552 stop:1295 length:744 start_codon:yes stop_codon:yes gene_type:complete